MQIDPSQHSAPDNYKLLTNLVVPRPIAWVTSQNADGVVNLAPFSFFNAVSGNPIYLIVSVGVNDAGEMKDTAKNILASGEFVVNMVTEELFDAMNVSAADFPIRRERAGRGQSACRAVGQGQAAAGGGVAGQHGMQAAQLAAARQEHADHRRGGDVPCRRSPDGPAHARQRFRADRTARARLRSTAAAPTASTSRGSAMRSGSGTRCNPIAGTFRCCISLTMCNTLFVRSSNHCSPRYWARGS